MFNNLEPRPSRGGSNVFIFQGIGEGVESEESYTMCLNNTWVNYTTDYLIAEQVNIIGQLGPCPDYGTKDEH